MIQANWNPHPELLGLQSGHLKEDDSSPSCSLLPSVASSCSHQQVIQQTWWRKFLLSGNVLVRGFLRLAALGVLCVLSQQQLVGAWMARWLTRHAREHRKALLQRGRARPALSCSRMLQTPANEFRLYKTLSLPSKDCRDGYMSSCLAWARPRVMSLMNQGIFYLPEEGLQSSVC